MGIPIGICISFLSVSSEPWNSPLPIRTSFFPKESRENTRGSFLPAIKVMLLCFSKDPPPFPYHFQIRKQILAFNIYLNYYNIHLTRISVQICILFSWLQDFPFFTDDIERQIDKMLDFIHIYSIINIGQKILPKTKIPQTSVKMLCGCMLRR